MADAGASGGTAGHDSDGLSAQVQCRSCGRVAPRSAAQGWMLLGGLEAGTRWILCDECVRTRLPEILRRLFGEEEPD